MNKMFGYRQRSASRAPKKEMMQKAKDGPPGYEGKEHVKYKDPGYSKHEIRMPEDEPHMKSRVGKDEMHEMEDNYHMDVPDQTEDTLPKKIKRARMNMDAPNQQDPKPLLGNLTTQIPLRTGLQDTDGEEVMGPNDDQDEESMGKEHRKKMIAAVVKKKMKKKSGDEE